MARILIADADAEMLDTLSMSLTALGHKVDTAKDGATARELLGTRKYDCALLDVELPKASGVRLLRMMRRSRHFKDMSIALMCSASARANWLLEQARETPPDALLSKPFAVRDLVDAVNVMVAGTAREAFRLGRLRRLSLKETTEF